MSHDGVAAAFGTKRRDFCSTNTTPVRRVQNLPNWGSAFPALATFPITTLAGLVYMSQTAFYLNFKEVMQVPPLQYAKSVKLLEAQRLLKEGKRVIEAGYQVCYNNLGQFRREYKRHFGYAPSATAAMTH